MSRPESTRHEEIMSVADTVVWAFQTYGFPHGAMVGARPNYTRNEAISSVSETVVWAWT